MDKYKAASIAENFLPRSIQHITYPAEGGLRIELRERVNGYKIGLDLNYATHDFKYVNETTFLYLLRVQLTNFYRELLERANEAPVDFPAPRGVSTVYQVGGANPIYLPERSFYSFDLDGALPSGSTIPAEERLIP